MYMTLPIFNNVCVRSVILAALTLIVSVTVSSVLWLRVWLNTAGHPFAKMKKNSFEKLKALTREPSLTVSIFQRKTGGLSIPEPAPWSSFISQK